MLRQQSGPEGLSAPEYLEFYNVGVYIEDVVKLVLRNQDERPLEYIHRYFQNVSRGANVVQRDFKYVSSTFRNRVAFAKVVYDSFPSLSAYGGGGTAVGLDNGRASEKSVLGALLTASDWHQLACLTCRDFPALLVERACLIFIPGKKHKRTWAAARRSPRAKNEPVAVGRGKERASPSSAAEASGAAAGAGAGAGTEKGGSPSPSPSSSLPTSPSPSPSAAKSPLRNTKASVRVEFDRITLAVAVYFSFYDFFTAASKLFCVLAAGIDLASIVKKTNFEAVAQGARNESGKSSSGVGSLAAGSGGAAVRAAITERRGDSRYAERSSDRAMELLLD